MRRHRAHDGACGSGCNYDSELVWSSTLCGEGPSFIARVSSPGDKQASADSTLCLEEATTTIASMRYADVHACTGHPTKESSHPPILAPASVTPSPTHLSPEPTAVDTAPTPQPSVRACTARARKPRAPARKARGRRRACARRAGRGYARRRSCREWHLPMHLFDPTDVAHAVALAPPDARAHALPYEPGPGDATPTHTPKGGGGVSKGTAMHDDHLFFLLD